MPDHANMLALLMVAEDVAMRLLGVLVGLLALGATWPALADEKFDPRQVRVITPTTATSICIGDPKTPICAVETLLACWARKKMKLCERVDVSYMPPGPPLAKSQYRLISIRILTEADMTPELAHTNWWKPGYADVVIQKPDFHLDVCDRDGCKSSYSIRPTSKGWQVVDWAVWGVEEFDKLPQSFPPRPVTKLS